LKRISTIRVVGNRWSFFIGLVFRPPVLQEVFLATSPNGRHSF
jgi:hypothetical protein